MEMANQFFQLVKLNVSKFEIAPQKTKTSVSSVENWNAQVVSFFSFFFLFLFLRSSKSTHTLTILFLFLYFFFSGHPFQQYVNAMHILRVTLVTNVSLGFGVMIVQMFVPLLVMVLVINRPMPVIVKLVPVLVLLKDGMHFVQIVNPMCLAIVGMDEHALRNVVPVMVREVLYLEDLVTVV